MKSHKISCFLLYITQILLFIQILTKCSGNSLGRVEKCNSSESSCSLGKLRVFKYVHFTTTVKPLSNFSSLTIPTSYYDKTNKTYIPIVNKKSLYNLNESELSGSERPRRSPYFPHHRYLNPHVNFHRNTNYRLFPIKRQDFYEDDYVLPEDESLNSFRFKKPPLRHPPMRRNPPRKIPPPPPRKIYKPPHFQHPPPHKIPLNYQINQNNQNQMQNPIQNVYPNNRPTYSYPREAGNIQEILEFFKNEERLKSEIRTTPSSDFSKELHDVQTSLLKDIREFSKRPLNLNGDEKSSSSTYAKKVPYEEKEVTNKNKNYDNDRKRESYEKEGKNDNYGRFKGENEGKSENYDRFRGGYKNKKYSGERDEESYERGERRKIHKNEESYEENRRNKNRNHDEDYDIRYKKSEKYPKNARNKYEIDEESEELKKSTSHPMKIRYRPREEELDSYETYRKIHSKNRDHSLNNRQIHTTKLPIVLKRPYGPYRLPHLEKHEEYEKVKKSQFLPNSQETVVSRKYYRNPVSDDYVDRDELIIAAVEQQKEKERREEIHKLYLEYLERKLEGGGVRKMVKKLPMRMKIQLYEDEESEGVSTNSQNIYNSSPTQRSQIKNYNVGNRQKLEKVIDFNENSSKYLRGGGVRTGVDKNKNLVLHLHVHNRRIDGDLDGESSIVRPSVVKIQKSEEENFTQLDSLIEIK